ncbi:MAG: FAD-binding oxidoreductase [Chryseobacterium sp.]|nr:MAG: FAD-binding oxidoreductase [Chryseobacterium sp.]
MNQMLSYWEEKSWFSELDYVIVGSGIVGITNAIFLKRKYTDAKILVLDKGIFPEGASTKNAGFACFGSLSELLSDIENMGEENTLNLVKMRWNGLQHLFSITEKHIIDYQQNGGFEVFRAEDFSLQQKCLEHIDKVNEMLFPYFQSTVFRISDADFGLGDCSLMIENPLEAQVDTGKMMMTLLQKAQQLGVIFLFSTEVQSYEDEEDHVRIQTQYNEFQAKKCILATNAFAKNFLPNEDIQPARAQVLLTEKIPNLSLKGTFHMDEGYYYFRNIHGRILLGGARNSDFKNENTTEFGITDSIQKQLEDVLYSVILPNQTHIKIEQRWSGIMALGNEKLPIVNSVSQNVASGIRLGGMGIALGTNIGKKLSEMLPL